MLLYTWTDTDMTDKYSLSFYERCFVTHLIVPLMPKSFEHCWSPIYLFLLSFVFCLISLKKLPNSAPWKFMLRLPLRVFIIFYFKMFVLNQELISGLIWIFKGHTNLTILFQSSKKEKAGSLFCLETVGWWEVSLKFLW
jgi:hypothetical protein